MKRALKFFAVAALVAGLLIAGSAWFFHHKLSSALESFLRAQVLSQERGAGFGRSGIDPFRAKIFLTDLRWNSLSGGLAWAFSAKELSLHASLSDVFAGRWTARRLRVLEPTLQVILSSSTGLSQDASHLEEPVSLQVLLGWLESLPVQQVSLESGRLSLQAGALARPLELHEIRFQADRSDPDRGLSIQGSGRLVQAHAGSFSLNIQPQSLGSLCPSQGELRIVELSLPELLRFFPTDPDLSLRSGQLNLNTQFTCKKSWLTASHLVEVKDFQMDLSQNKKELFGIPAKYLKDFSQIDHLSFVVPMNGPIGDLHIGIASSIQQILLKVLESKLGDRDRAEALAKKGGDYFGKKLDKAFKNWLRGKS